VTGREWKSAAASLVLHGSLIAGALALNGFAHDADTAIVIDFSLLPSRVVPGEAPAGAAVPSVEAERPAANTTVAENPPAVAKPPLLVKKPVLPPSEPVPLLQEETKTAAPVPTPVEPGEEVVEDLSEEREIVTPAVTTVAASPVNISDATPLSSSEHVADAAEMPPDNHRMAHSGAASGEGRSSPADSGNGGDSLSADGPSGATGAGGDSTGGTPASQRDFSFIREKIQRNTRYPRLARQMGLEGQVKVSFTVCHDGKIMDLKVMESSGVSILDKCAIEAVKKTSPFPSQQLEAKVIIPIVYRLNE
jgi:TonB family protein